MAQLAERTQRGWKVGRTASTGRFITVSQAKKNPNTAVIEAFRKKKEEAVLDYVRTVRGLGKTRLSTRDVADALDLNERDVRRIMLSLQREGVRAR